MESRLTRSPRHLRGSDGKGLHIVMKTSIEAASASPFSQALLDHLRKLFSGSSTSLRVHGSAISSFTSQPPKGDPWIIDSDASDHMSSTQSLFHGYFPYHVDRRVKLADGFFTYVAGLGTIWLNDFFCLSSVLYVPSLSCNLLSISKVTVDLRCLVKFSPFYCIFQDQHSGRMIERAKVFSRLYYFMCDLSMEVCCNVTACSSSSIHHCRQFMLLHYRLGHPSFSYMRRLFPNLISNNDFQM